VALEWFGPGREELCLGGDRLAEHVESYLGRPAFSLAPADVTLLVRVERRDWGWRALLQLRESGTGAVLGERELVSDAALCSGLDEPLELAVALMVDDEPSSETPSAESAAPATPESTPRAAIPAQRRRSAANAWSVSLEGALLGELGALPGELPGAELGVLVSPVQWLSLRVYAAGFLPRSQYRGSAGAEFSLVYGGLALCPTWLLDGTWAASACAGANLGALRADGSSFEEGRVKTSRFVAGSLSVRASAKLGSGVTLLGQLSAFAPYRPERFVYELDGQRRELFQMASAFAVAGVGASVMF
jgi:hypothetical protein